MSCLTYPISRLLSPVSRLLSHVCCQSPSLSNLGFLCFRLYVSRVILQLLAFNTDFHANFGPEMAQIIAILIWRHCHRTIFCLHLRFTAKGATFFLVRSSGVVALKVVQMPSTAVQYIMYNCIYSTEK